MSRMNVTAEKATHMFALRGIFCEQDFDQAVASAVVAGFDVRWSDCMSDGRGGLVAWLKVAGSAGREAVGDALEAAKVRVVWPVVDRIEAEFSDHGVARKAAQANKGQLVRVVDECMRTEGCSVIELDADIPDNVLVLEKFR